MKTVFTALTLVASLCGHVDARSFQTGHFIMTLTDKEANAENSAWNACAIEKGQRYLYFSEGILHRRTLKSVPKAEW